MTLTHQSGILDNRGSLPLRALRWSQKGFSDSSPVDPGFLMASAAGLGRLRATEQLLRAIDRWREKGPAKMKTVTDLPCRSSMLLSKLEVKSCREYSSVVWWIASPVIWTRYQSASKGLDNLYSPSAKRQKESQTGLKQMLSERKKKIFLKVIALLLATQKNYKCASIDML